MTVSVQLATVADSISGLSISGVTIKDFDSLTASWKSQPYVMYPNPENPFGNFSLTRDSQGTGGTAQFTLTYNLNYRLLGLALGDVGQFGGSYSALVAKLVLILNAIITNDSVTGAVDISPTGTPTIGPRTDPAGNQYFGCDFSIRVQEFIN